MKDGKNGEVKGQKTEGVKEEDKEGMKRKREQRVTDGKR